MSNSKLINKLSFVRPFLYERAVDLDLELVEPQIKYLLEFKIIGL